MEFPQHRQTWNRVYTVTVDEEAGCEWGRQNVGHGHGKETYVHPVSLGYGFTSMSLRGS